MSNSQHPVALEVERRVGGSIRLLATVMALPLVDGIFPALILAGALETTGGIFQVGLLVFGGSATVAVVLAEMGENPRSRIPAIAAFGVVLVTVATIEAALAPTIGTLLDLDVFKRFAALVILAVAAATASARVGEVLPRPAIIVALGLVASLDPAGATFQVSVDPILVARGAAAAGVGVAFALLVALLAAPLRGLVDVDRFRFGSAVALGTLGLSLFDLAPGNAALAVLGVTALLAFDPGSEAGAATPGVDDGQVTGGGETDETDAGDADGDGRRIPRRERDPWM
ncbi:MAG: DUF5794 domain-containing protein [Halobacteriales archaeon]